MGRLVLDLQNASGVCGVASQCGCVRAGKCCRRLGPKGRFVRSRRAGGARKLLTRYHCVKGATVCFVEQVCFADKYEVRERIGSGVYGTVFRARDRVSGEWLAVKELVTNRKSRAGRNEATILSTLRGSPAVVGLMDFVEEFSEDGGTKTSRMVMDLCGGGDLDEFVKCHGNLSADQALAVVTEALRAIEHCHRNRICHSDVKGANFMIASPAAKHLLQTDPASLRPGWLKLVDMGTARVVGLGSCSELLGTPTHWSPEVFGRKYSFPVDLWSCGTMMYKLITGSMPFWSGEEEDGMKEQADIVRKILLSSRDFGALKQGCGSKQVLAELIENMLSIDPSQRISARDGLETLNGGCQKTGRQAGWEGGIGGVPAGTPVLCAP